MENGKLAFWSVILIALIGWFAVSCTSTNSEPEKIVVTKPVIIEYTGPVIYVMRWSWSPWSWQYQYQWLLPEPPVQAHYYNIGETQTLPRDTKHQIDLYVDNGVPTGSFLYAVLSNNLMEAFMKADEYNKAGLELICEYIQHFTPVLCHGSPERVRKWQELHRNVPKSAHSLAGQDRERREAYYKSKAKEDGE